MNIKRLSFILFTLRLKWVKSVMLCLIYFSSIHAGEVSLSISEELINQYLKVIGNYKTVQKKDKGEWSIQNPHVKLKNNEALFLAKVKYKQGLINIRKDIKLNLRVKYDLKKNELFLIFDNSIIDMERRGILLNSIDLKKRGQNLSQMALAWVLNNKAITSALIGARTVTQLRDCLASLDNLKFGKEEIKKINQKAKDGDINIWAPSSSY